MVQVTGLEPARVTHQNLNLARLPIPPHLLIVFDRILSNPIVLYYTSGWISTYLFCAAMPAGRRIKQNRLAFRCQKVYPSTGSFAAVSRKILT